MDADEHSPPNLLSRLSLGRKKKKEKKKKKEVAVIAADEEEKEGEDMSVNSDGKYGYPQDDISFSRDAYSKLLENIECPICTDVFRSPPIFQCSGGHAICSKCIEQLPSPRKCPHCRESIGDIRNRSLEALIGSLPVPCKNQEHGCRVMQLSDVLESHETECSFLRFECPGIEGICCPWLGAASEVVTHLKEKHNWAERTDFGQKERSLKITSSIGFAGELVDTRAWSVSLPVRGHDFICIVKMPIDSKRISLSIYHVDSKPFGRYRMRIPLKDGHEVIHSGNIPSILDEPDPDLAVTIARNALLVLEEKSTWVHMSIFDE